MLRLTTTGVRPKERVEYWADLVGRHVTVMDIVPSGPRMRGEIEAWPIDDLVTSLACVSGHGLRAEHTRAHVERAEAHFHAACVHLDGDTTLTAHGQTRRLRRGDIFFTDSRVPFSIGLERPWRHLVLTLPSATLDARVSAPRAALSGLVVRNAPVGRLWATHLAAGFAAGGDMSREALALFARHSVDMLVHVVDEAVGGVAPPTPPRAAIYLSATHAIAACSIDPALTPSTIARRVGVSPRTLARAFADRNETVMQHVYAERVRQAARRLRSSAWAHRSVTDIAFACGFSDLSHFGRLFADALGASPSRYRRAAMPAPTTSVRSGRASAGR